MWYLFDAQWQDPFVAARVLARYLAGRTKPIFHPLSLLQIKLIIYTKK